MTYLFATGFAAMLGYFFGHYIGYGRAMEDATRELAEAIVEESPYNIEGQRKAGREGRN